MRMEKDAHADSVARSRDSKFKAQKEIAELVEKTIPAREARAAELEKLIEGNNWKLNDKEIDRKDLAEQLQTKIDKRTEKILNDTKSPSLSRGTPEDLRD